MPWCGWPQCLDSAPRRRSRWTPKWGRTPRRSDLIEQLSRMSASALTNYQDAVVRLAAVPGFGAESSQQMVAEVGVDAEAFPSAGKFASWVGVCPGSNVTAEENQSSHCPKGN